jgi:hypothetical protein
MQSTLSNLTAGTTSGKYQAATVNTDGNNHNASGTYLSTLAQTQDSQSTNSDNPQLQPLFGSEYSRFTGINMASAGGIPRFSVQRCINIINIIFLFPQAPPTKTTPASL